MAKTKTSKPEPVKKKSPSRNGHKPKTKPDDNPDSPFASANSFGNGSIHWLIQDLVPYGSITFLDGDPGVGKTAIIFDWVSRLSRGEIGSEERARIGAKTSRVGCGSLLMIERDPSTILNPRLVASGCILDHVYYFGRKPGQRFCGSPQFPSCVAEIREAILKTGAELLAIDPLTSHLLDSGTTSERDIRRAFEPLAELVAELDIACVCTRHLTKAQGVPAKYRGAGGMALLGIATTAYICETHPDDDTQFVLSQHKSNLGPPPQAQIYKIEPRGEAFALVWGGCYSGSTQDLLDGAEEIGKRQTLKEAERLLRLALSGREIPALDVLQEARDNGIGERTLRAAKARLDVPVRRVKQGSKCHWVWGPLPELTEETTEEVPDQLEGGDKS